ncbi:hypothetical protein [Massilia niabensis]|uniref:Prolin-rich transmembrane protein n=1 Tax=Massilia niabensis TaxID=544910 RepID=A0ABW0LAG8_9BURK
MKTRHMIMGAALVAAAALVAFGDNSPEGEVAEAVERAEPSAPAAATAAAPAADAGLAQRAQTPARLPPVTPVQALPAGAAQPPGAKTTPHILRLLPRHALVRVDGLKQGSNAFGTRDWTPPPPPPPAPVAPPPPPPPTAPPLPFTLLGKALENGVWEVYLARAGQTYIVKPKTVIDGTYRVDAIAPPILTLTYLPLNQVQQLNIGAFD